MSLQDRLREARHSRFVGREAECALFAEALDAETLPFHVLYLYGPGGIGKTALLREFQNACRRADVPSVYLDGRNIDPTPEAFEQAIGRAPVPDGRAALLIDTYETLHDLDNWLRDDFLPTVSEDLIVVLSGRYPPGTVWRSDPGWREVVCVLPLRNLTPAESMKLLDAAGVPESEFVDILRFTHGHPLALALIADRSRHQPDTPFEVDDSPDVVGTLLQRFMQEIPEGGERDALEAAAAVRVVTEGLLAELLGRDDAREAFAWLRELSFIEAGVDGLFLHDLVRDVLAADLRWRRPDRFDELNHTARAYYTRRLLSTEPESVQQAILADYTFLHRHNPIVEPFFAQLRGQWREAKLQTTGQPQEEEWDVLRAMVAAHEGEASAEIAVHWFERQPQNVQVFRDEDGLPTGFLLRLALEATTEADRAADPGAKAAWDYLREHAPLREGAGAGVERATCFRFWMDREHHQGVSAVQSLIFVATVRHYLQTEGLAFTFLPCAMPEFWAAVFTYVGLRRLEEADFEVGGRTYGVYGHDWRAVPPARWLNSLAEQGLPGVPDEPMADSPDRLVVLSRPDFAEAVHDALRAFARPHALEANPLLRSRLVTEAADGEERIETLRALLNEAAEELNATPREEPYYLAVDATYLDPARTQAEAAEQLDMPFSSYRRYLKRGVEHIVEALWQREVAA